MDLMLIARPNIIFTMNIKISNALASKHNGFTLIEVMVVVVLIGLMASLVQFNFSGSKLLSNK